MNERSLARRSLTLVAIAAMFAASPARAQCRPDELRIELPSAPAAAAARAEVEVVGGGGDPYATPDGGFCVVQDGRAAHLPEGETRRFAVPASSTELLEIRVGRDVLHVSMPAGSWVRFRANACTPWLIEGPDLDVVDHHGERPGAPAQLRIASGAVDSAASVECVAREGEIDAGTRPCTTPAQLGWCMPASIRHRGRVHTFWPRAGETWSVTIGPRSITTGR